MAVGFRLSFLPHKDSLWTLSSPFTHRHIVVFCSGYYRVGFPTISSSPSIPALVGSTKTRVRTQIPDDCTKKVQFKRVYSGPPSQYQQREYGEVRFEGKNIALEILSKGHAKLHGTKDAKESLGGAQFGELENAAAAGAGVGMNGGKGVERELAYMADPSFDMDKYCSERESPNFMVWRGGQGCLRTCACLRRLCARAAQRDFPVPVSFVLYHFPCTYTWTSEYSRCRCGAFRVKKPRFLKENKGQQRQCIVDHILDAGKYKVVILPNEKDPRYVYTQVLLSGALVPGFRRENMKEVEMQPGIVPLLNLRR